MRGENHDDDEPCFGEGPERSDLFQSTGGTSSSRPTSVRNEDRTEQHCPVCSRTWVTDNQGLNEHIDFCLSRDAIREARTSAGAR